MMTFHNQARSVMKTGRSISVTSWTLKARHLEAIFFQSVIDKIPGILTNEHLPRPSLKAYFVEHEFHSLTGSD